MNWTSRSTLYTVQVKCLNWTSLMQMWQTIHRAIKTKLGHCTKDSLDPSKPGIGQQIVAIHQWTLQHRAKIKKITTKCLCLGYVQTFFISLPKYTEFCKVHNLCHIPLDSHSLTLFIQFYSDTGYKTSSIIKNLLSSISTIARIMVFPVMERQFPEVSLTL